MPSDTLTHEPMTQELKEFDLLASVNLFEKDYEQNGEFTDPVERRVLQEEMTHIAEGISGRLVTDFSYGYRNGRVIAADGTPLLQMNANGLKTAEFDADRDQRLAFHLRRAKHDFNEASIIEEMMAGQTAGNTIISFSLFPEEAAKQFGDTFVEDKGYQPKRRLSFIRIYHKSGAGLDATTIAIDNSDPEIFRKIAARRGVNIPEGTSTDDFLGYLMEQNLDETGLASLKQELVDEYDQDLSAKLGEKTHFGRPESETQVDVWEFIKNNQDLIDHHIAILKSLSLRRHGVSTPQLEEFINRTGSNDDDLSLKRNSLYMTWAAIKARFDKYGGGDPAQYAGGDVMSELIYSGHEAMSNLERMVGCGGAIMGDLEEEMMHKLIFGETEKRDPNATYKTGFCKYTEEDGCPAKGGVTKIGDCCICVDCAKRF